MVTARHLVEPLSESRQHTGFLQRGHGQKNAQEEENRGHVDLTQDRRHALFGRAVAVFFHAIEHFRERPKQAEHQEDAHIRRQVGETVENGHEKQTAHTEEEDQTALKAGELVHIGHRFLLALLRTAERAVQMVLQQQGRHHHRHQTGQENLFHHTDGSDRALDPKHDRRHIADGREGTAGIGGNHNETDVVQTIFMTVDQLTQHHDHDNRGGQVVEHGRKDKGDEGNFPQERPLGLGTKGLAHKVEPTVRIDDLYHRHGPHEEEERLTDFAEMLAQDVRGHEIHHGFARSFQLIGIKHRDIFGGAEGVKHPAGHTHEQRHCGLVDFDHVFEGDAEIPENEDRDDEGS